MCSRVSRAVRRYLATQPGLFDGEPVCHPHDGRQVPCEHCQETRTYARKRGLYWRCYRSTRIRSQHARRWSFAPTAGPLARDFPGQPQPPQQPARTAPGSPERVSDYAARYERRESLHGDDDVREPMTETSYRRALALFTMIGAAGASAVA